MKGKRRKGDNTRTKARANKVLSVNENCKKLKVGLPTHLKTVWCGFFDALDASRLEE